MKYIIWLIIIPFLTVVLCVALLSAAVASPLICAYLIWKTAHDYKVKKEKWYRKEARKINVKQILRSA